MTGLVQRGSSPIKVGLMGTVMGLLVGWGAAVVLWIFSGSTLLILSDQDIGGVFVIALFGILFYGSLGGLGAGLLCGVTWAIWARPKTNP
jgi:hypothetical protein